MWDDAAVAGATDKILSALGMSQKPKRKGPTKAVNGNSCKELPIPGLV
jgi:hypothetical protein